MALTSGQLQKELYIFLLLKSSIKADFFFFLSLVYYTFPSLNKNGKSVILGLNPASHNVKTTKLRVTLDAFLFTL